MLSDMPVAVTGH